MPYKSPIVRFEKFLGLQVLAFTTNGSIDFALNDQPSFNSKQKKFLSRQHLDPTCFGFMKQVHGKKIIVVRKPSCISVGAPSAMNCGGGRPTVAQQGDGMMTQRPGIPLSVRTADCLSVFIFDPKKIAIALVHAGWKGTQKKIVANAVRLMKRKWKTKAKDLKVAFGPSIRKCCYEVGEEFKKLFPNACCHCEPRRSLSGRSNLDFKNQIASSSAQKIQPPRPAALAPHALFRKAKLSGRGGRNDTIKRLYLDLPLVNKRQLLKTGVRARNIFDCGICTCCNSKYFSFRRDGKKAGRMLSVMMIKDQRKNERPGQ